MFNTDTFLSVTLYYGNDEIFTLNCDQKLALTTLELDVVTDTYSNTNDTTLICQITHKVNINGVGIMFT